MKRIYHKAKYKLQEKSPRLYKHLDKRKLYIKYLIAGTTATFINLSVLYFLTDILGFWYIFSTTISFVCAFSVSFYLQKFWTFRDNDKERARKQVVIYLFVNIGNLFLNAVGMYLLVDFLNIWYMFAQIITGMCVAISSFIIYKFIIFKNDNVEKLNFNKKILITTGIYPPDIGGPATYAENLSKELVKLGYNIKIITYKKIPAEAYKKVNENIRVYFVNSNQNIILKYFNFFKKVKELLKWADFSYTLDLVSVGFPTVLASKIRRKKVFFRTGGDFLWEKSFQSGKTRSPLKKYYKEEKSFSEKLLMLFSKWILNNINLMIFSTDLQKNIYKEYYKVSEEKSIILKNAYPQKISSSNEDEAKDGREKEDYIVFAGRLIKLKNINRLIDAFEFVDDKNLKLYIYGEGPERGNIISKIKDKNLENRVLVNNKISQEQLRGVINKSLFTILPSFTEISPNLALECIGGGKPIILTKENGLDEEVVKNIITVDPESTEDIAGKINYLLDRNNLDRYIEKLKNKKLPNWSWPEIAEAHDKLFKKYL